MKVLKVILSVVFIYSHAVSCGTRECFNNIEEKGIAGLSKKGWLNLLQKKFDRNYPYESGFLILHYAISTGDNEIITKLIEQGADVNGVNNSPIKMFSPLAFAAYQKKYDIVDLLIQRGAVLNQNPYGYEPILTIVYDYETVKFLIDKGAEIDAKGEYGITPLSTAVVNGELKSAKLLISLGASLDNVIENGETLLTAALSSGNIKMIEFISKEMKNKGLSFKDEDLSKAKKMGDEFYSAIYQ